MTASDSDDLADARPFTEAGHHGVDTMARLTITIDDRILWQARVRALEDGTSISAVLRSFIERYAGDVDAVDALAAFGHLSRERCRERSRQQDLKARCCA